MLTRQHADIVRRQEVFRHHLEQHDAGGYAERKENKDDPFVAHAPAQAAVIGALQRLKAALAPLVKGVMLFVPFVFQDPRAQHRREGHRNDARNQDRQHHGHREFMQQAADNAAHENQGNKNRDQ